ncbi:MAG: sensor domain-containing diguanylate cyclase [Hydrogenoanaerobacterium sp.]
MEQLKKTWKTLSLILLLSILISAIIITKMQTSAKKSENERISYVTLTQASKLQASINSLFQKTQTLKLLIIQGNGMIANFEEVAAELVNDPSIRSIQLAPNGVVTSVYPVKGNENAYKDLFSDPNCAKEVIMARDSNKLTMSGPFEVSQGEFVVIGRQPVFLKDADGKDKFWGFTIIVLDLPKALAPSGLNLLVQEGYNYKLHRVHPDTDDVQVFSESSAAPLTDAINISFEVPNSVWTLSVEPKIGWINYGDLVLQIFLAIMICSLIVFASYMMISLNARHKELEALSVTDTLTGLYNRRKMQDVLTERCTKTAFPFLLCYFDLNDFKGINDVYGHDAGDYFLIACADRFRECLNPGEMLFRVGGDEFVAILKQGSGPNDWEKRVEQFNNKLIEPIVMSSYKLPISVSIGTVLFPQDGEDSEQLLQVADAMMYGNKAEYKSRRAADKKAETQTN